MKTLLKKNQSFSSFVSSFIITKQTNHDYLFTNEKKLKKNGEFFFIEIKNTKKSPKILCLNFWKRDNVPGDKTSKNMKKEVKN